MIVRVILGFLLLCVGVAVAVVAVELLVSFFNIVTNYRLAQLVRIVGAAAAGFGGVLLGKVALDRLMKTYPGREIAMVFIGINVLLLLGALLTSSAGTTGLESVVRSAVSIATAFNYLWSLKSVGAAKES